jgi:ABC-type glycerol-3-phosphate transport system substrate-binding protein
MSKNRIIFLMLIALTFAMLNGCGADANVAVAEAPPLIPSESVAAPAVENAPSSLSSTPQSASQSVQQEEAPSDLSNAPPDSALVALSPDSLTDIAVSSVMEESGTLRVAEFVPDDIFITAKAVFEERFPAWTVESSVISAPVDNNDGTVSIDLTFMSDLVSKTYDMMRNGEVDLVSVNPAMYGRPTEPELFEDLLLFFQDDMDTDLNNLLPNLRELLEFNGRLTQIPIWFSSYHLKPKPGVVINREADPPKDWSWQDASDWFADDFKANGMEKITEDHSAHFFQLLFECYSSYYIDAYSGEIYFDSPVLHEILNTVKWLYDNGRLNGLNWNDAEPYETVDNLLVASAYQKLDDDDTFPFPVIPGTTGRAAHSNLAYGINAKSSDSVKQAAWEFIKILLSDEIQNTEVIDAGFIPVIAVLNKSGLAKIYRDENLTAEAITDEELAEYNAKRLEAFSDINRLSFNMETGLRGILFPIVSSYVEGTNTLEETISLMKEKYAEYTEKR